MSGDGKEQEDEAGGFASSIPLSVHADRRKSEPDFEVPQLGFALEEMIPQPTATALNMTSFTFAPNAFVTVLTSAEGTQSDHPTRFCSP